MKIEIKHVSSEHGDVWRLRIWGNPDPVPLYCDSFTAAGFLAAYGFNFKKTPDGYAVINRIDRRQHLLLCGISRLTANQPLENDDDDKEGEEWKSN